VHIICDTEGQAGNVSEALLAAGASHEQNGRIVTFGPMGLSLLTTTDPGGYIHADGGRIVVGDARYPVSGAYTALVEAYDPDTQRWNTVHGTLVDGDLEQSATLAAAAETTAAGNAPLQGPWRVRVWHGADPQRPEADYAVYSTPTCPQTGDPVRQTVGVDASVARLLVELVVAELATALRRALQTVDLGALGTIVGRTNAAPPPEPSDPHDAHNIYTHPQPTMELVCELNELLSTAGASFRQPAALAAALADALDVVGQLGWHGVDARTAQEVRNIAREATATAI
jgi:hypothetical protein